MFCVVAILRIASPTDVYRGDQHKQADYVVDIVKRGNWIVQHHEGTIIASKPPLYNWIAAPFLKLYGEANDFILKIPSLIAGCLTLLMLWDITRRTINLKVALYATLFLCTAPMFVKQMYFARTDMLVVMFMMVQFWIITLWTMSRKRKILIFFWIFGGLGALSKGPLVFIFPHIAIFVSWLCEGSLKKNYSQIGFIWGVPLLFVPLLGWAGFIYFIEGPEVFRAVYDRLVNNETLDRFNSAALPTETRSLFYYVMPTLLRSLPWSIFFIGALFLLPWKCFRKSDLTSEQKILIHGFCWVATIFVLMSVVPSKRIVRIFPVIPFICLLAGWYYNFLIEKYIFPRRKLEGIITLFLILGTTSLVAIDRNVFCHAARDKDNLYAQVFCRECFKYLKEKEKEGQFDKLLILNKNPYPLRYYLMNPDRRVDVDEAKHFFEMQKGHFYIVGNKDEVLDLKKQGIFEIINLDIRPLSESINELSLLRVSRNQPESFDEK